jgi:hypothetical protein
MVRERHIAAASHTRRHEGASLVRRTTYARLYPFTIDMYDGSSSLRHQTLIGNAGFKGTPPFSVAGICLDHNMAQATAKV